MSSKAEADIIHAKGAIMVRRSAVGIVDIPANGVLSVNLEEGSAITIGGGGALELLGIEYLDRDGAPVSIDQQDATLKSIRAVSGVTIVVRHNATLDLLAQAIPAQQRLFTTSLNDFEIRQANVRGFFAYVDPLADFRWVMVEDLAYAAAVPADWPNPKPTSLIQAADVLAARSSSAELKAVVAPKLLGTLVAGDEVYVVYRGPTAKLLGVSVVLDGALTVLTTITFAVTIDGVAVTDGDVTFTAAQAGVGVARSATPTANNDLVDGAVIRVQSSTLANLIPTLGSVTLLVGPG